VNSRVLAIAAVLALLVLGAGWYFVSAPPAAVVEPDVPAPSASTPAPAPAPVTPDRPARTDRSAAAAPRDTLEAAAVPEVVPAAPGTATLRVDSDVPGADVFLDRQLVGKAPVTIPNVAPGSHRLNVSAEGFDGSAETIDVTAGTRDIMVRLRDVKLDATLAVVHKHRVGSCQGQLSATPGGIRYDTTNADDTFTVALADLEVFTVDYLEKNLRVKRRGGRQFNFTDAEGDADKLFVFHRDVTKARERLARGDVPAAP
jgi:hypothetical protein